MGTVIGAQVQEDVESLKRLVRKQLDLDIQRYMILSWACGPYLGWIDVEKTAAPKTSGVQQINADFGQFKTSTASS